MALLLANCARCKMDRSDQNLLMLVGQGDEQAFKCLFSNHRDKLFAYLLKVTKSRETAEEIVMDVFLKLWQSRDILSEIQNFPSFIFLVARNKAYDFLRTASKDLVLKDLLWDEIEMASSSRTDERIVLSELQSKLDNAVSKLSPQRQSVFRLSREEHLTHDQIAARLKISKSTVKNHMIDSLRFIREHLDTNLDLILLCVILFKK